ncbi:sensor histidine kinase [Fulvivirga sedimenti]|uniref:histidine kinase n=1 Tax=Fulvivirga sedimenti TaxID=2879465 RepID=A0A9X1HQZ8_9BACT|nr:ATP-binding protein [Fulvivirga sedimenti]MCA6075188.1 histidine kinase [Fulvivirga sedimenti]MCA6076365.1 histidine kinase [Fulvivirga sedimenti]MCA6077493.1 histidine kinase [Fulvivirga sedimenti]
MGFKGFRIRVIIRVILIAATLAVMTYTLIGLNAWFAFVVLSFILAAQLADLFHFVETTNRKLTRFLESIRYSDFVSTFTTDSRLGDSFKDLNIAFNEVLEAFRLARSEKETNLHFLNTIVEHVSTGLLGFDNNGNIELINASTKRLIGIYAIHNIEDLLEKHPKFYKTIFDLPTGKSTIYRNQEEEQISVSATEIILRGKKVKLISLQNIQTQLQKKEIEAWQNLTRVLRHEIMNSITPIASLTTTLRTILAEDLRAQGSEYVLDEETKDDLTDGLGTIEGRSKGLISFIDAYRDYTSIPLPDPEPIVVKDLLHRIETLLKSSLDSHNINLKLYLVPENLVINADDKLIEQVLINLVKNAIEASPDDSAIHLYAGKSDDGNARIVVEDHGQGIIREALDKIFIPFYTTKKTGSGIGLSLSRQIMQLHNGSLTADSEPGKFTRFTLKF